MAWLIECGWKDEGCPFTSTDLVATQAHLMEAHGVRRVTFYEQRREGSDEAGYRFTFCSGDHAGHLSMTAQRPTLDAVLQDPALRDTYPGMPLYALVAAAKARGFTHVRSHGGWVPLAEWTPYGNGIEHTVRFWWINETQVVDGDPAHPMDAPLGCGVWELARKEP
jgi:hypothetical protein